MYVYGLHVCLVPTEVKTGCWLPLEQEIQMVSSHHVGSGNQTQVLIKSNKYT